MNLVVPYFEYLQVLLFLRLAWVRIFQEQSVYQLTNALCTATDMMYINCYMLRHQGRAPRYQGVRIHCKAIS
jgi:hypothetical protein